MKTARGRGGGDKLQLILNVEKKLEARKCVPAVTGQKEQNLTEMRGFGDREKRIFLL